MKDPVGVQVFEAAQHHYHVRLDVGGREDDVVPIPNDLLQISVHVIVDEIDVGSVAKDIDKLTNQTILLKSQESFIPATQLTIP